jgi:hypothetical protein
MTSLLCSLEARVLMEIQAWMAWMEMTARTENQDQRALLVPQAPRVLPEKPDLLL